MKKIILLFSLFFSFTAYGEDLLLKGGNIHTAAADGVLENTDIYIKNEFLRQFVPDQYLHLALHRSPTISHYRKT